MLFNQIINLRGLDRGVRKQHLPSFLHYFGASRTVAAAAAAAAAVAAGRAAAPPAVACCD